MSARKPILNVKLLPHGLAELSIGDGAGPTVHVPMTAEQIDRYIAGLADIRSKMKPEVPASYPQGKAVHQIHATNYAVGTDGLSLRPTLALRTESFGWLKFDFDHEAALAISDLLRDHATRSPDTNKPN